MKTDRQKDKQAGTQARRQARRQTNTQNIHIHTQNTQKKLRQTDRDLQSSGYALMQSTVLTTAGRCRLGITATVNS